ncbi:MAG: AAA family ATPase, partial [Patescibacteria group bacterium]
PCDKCSSCKAVINSSNIDVIELDAASHRGIDDVRTLRDAVKLAPARAKMKVYIIDEAHMLTKEAANALLKTLEEPPEHVMFILATTNPEKLIETVRSRAFSVDFKKANNDELTRSLSRVVKGEKIKVEKGTLELIARASDGSFRDATKILEQLVTERDVLIKNEVEDYLFQKRSMDIDNFISLLIKKDTKALLSEIEKVVSNGGSIRIFCEAIITRLRNGLLAKVGVERAEIDSLSRDDLIFLMRLFTKALDELPGSVLDQIPVELAVIEWCESELKTESGRSDSKGNKNNSSKVRVKNSQNKPLKMATTSVTQTVQSAKKSAVSVTEEIWSQILTAVRPKNTSTEALLRAARPLQYDGDTLTLGVFYRFHKEKLETAFHRRILEDKAGQILGGPVRIECTLTSPPEKKSQGVEDDKEQIGRPVKDKSKEVVLTEGEDDDIIKVANEIFGH